MSSQEPIQAGPLSHDLPHALREGGYDVSALAQRAGNAPAHDSIADARTVVQRLANDRALSLAAVARQLCVSERTLQRRLAAAGTGFRELCNDVRCELARQYLADSTQSLGEIAFRLGFDDANSFFRSFRRWTGTTPGSFRRSAESADSGAQHD